MELNRYVEVLARRKWVLLAPLLVALVGAIAASILMPRVYSASASVRIALVGQSGESVNPDYAERLTNTYVEIVRSRPVLASVIARLNLSDSPDELLGRIDVEALPATELIRIKAEAGSPGEARNLANALAQALVEEGRTFYGGSDSALAGGFAVVEPAVAPKSPARPDWRLNIAIGLLVGLAAGVGLSLALEYTDGTIRSVKDVEGVTEQPLLGLIPRSRRPAINGAAFPGLARGRDFLVSAEYRALAANLRGRLEKQQLGSVLVTSARPGEGATSVAVSMAVALAQGGMELLLVEADLDDSGLQGPYELLLSEGDLRDPALQGVFHRRHHAGLRNVLVTSADGVNDVRKLLAEAVQPSRVDGLTVLTSGSKVGDPSRLLASAEMRKLVEVFGNEIPVAIIDGPALLHSGDGMAIAPLVGGVVMVCAEGTGNRRSVERVMDQLHGAGANVLGLVYNKALQT